MRSMSSVGRPFGMDWGEGTDVERIPVHTIRLLIVDDHTLVRLAFRKMLEAMPGFEITAEADNGREALRQIQTQQPTVVLMDVVMPLLNGLDTTAQLSKAYPGVRVLMISMNADQEAVSRALRAGAAGYLLKTATPAELELAIRTVAQGKMYLSPAVAVPVPEDVEDIHQQTTGEESRGAPGSSLDRLSSRQREILQLIAEGYTTRAIADQLYLGVKTVETHRMQLMKRLNIHNLAGLVRYAVRRGLVSADQ